MLQAHIHAGFAESQVQSINSQQPPLTFLVWGVILGSHHSAHTTSSSLNRRFSRGLRHQKAWSICKLLTGLQAAWWGHSFFPLRCYRHFPSLPRAVDPRFKHSLSFRVSVNSPDLIWHLQLLTAALLVPLKSISLQKKSISLQKKNSEDMQNPGQEECMEELLQRVQRKSLELRSLPCCSRNYISEWRKIQCTGLPKWTSGRG